MKNQSCFVIGSSSAFIKKSDWNKKGRTERTERTVTDMINDESARWRFYLEQKLEESN